MSRDIPSIPSGIADDLRWPLVRMREELQALLGFGPADRAALTQATGGAGSTTVIVQEVTGGGGGTTPDLTPPPTPSSFAAVAGLSQVLISWSGIGYPQGNGHKQANLYGVQRDPASVAPLPTFGDAQRVHVAPNALTITSIPSDLNRQWHLWLTFETNDGVEGSPAGGTNGVVVTTGQDINQLLTVLEGQIGLSQLYRTLVAPLRDSMRRSDDAGLAQLSTLMATHADTQDTALALLREAEDRGTVIADVRRVVDEGDTQLAQRIEVLRAEVQSPTTGLAATALALDAVEAIVTAGGSGNAALASRTSALEVSVNTPTDGNNPTYAALSVTSTAFANYTGYASTLYAVRTQVSAGGRTVIGGFGLQGSSGGTAGPTIDFGVVANRFYVAAPSTETGLTDILPFVIQATPTTINGVAVPAGVYMDAAFILNGSITNAKIGNAVIDDAKIASLSADKLTAGTVNAARIGAGTITADKLNVTSLSAITANMGALSVDGALTMGTTGHLKGGQTAYATGTGFFLGFSGGAYKFSIGSGANMLTWDGSALTLGGIVNATGGSIGGVVIGASFLRSSNYVANTAGFNLNATTGEVEANRITVRSGTATSQSQDYSAALSANSSVGAGGGYQAAATLSSTGYSRLVGGPVLGIVVGEVSIPYAGQMVSASSSGTVEVAFAANWGGPVATLHRCRVSFNLSIWSTTAPGASPVFFENAAAQDYEEITWLNPSRLLKVPFSMTTGKSMALAGTYVAVLTVFVDTFIGDTDSPLFAINPAACRVARYSTMFSNTV